MNITFPRLANYHIPIKTFLKSIFPKASIIVPPPFTKHTLQLGARYSPDFVCAPFKYNLGNFIQSIQAGADTIFQIGGGCRFGFYGTLHEQILRDLGYNFTFVKLIEDGNTPSFRQLCAKIKALGGHSGYINVAHALLLAVKSIRFMDELDAKLRELSAYELQAGEHKTLIEKSRTELANISNLRQLFKLKSKYKTAFSAVKIDTNKAALRVGIIGELYDVMEPFANRNVEKALIKNGISISRHMNASYLLFQKKNIERKTVEAAAPYVKYALGADGTYSVALAQEFAKNNYDGIIHIKPFGCTPELNAIPMLNKISNDYNIPILNFSFDTLTTETGVETRLEAFCDMLKWKKEKQCI